jgi:putative addiction module component (TIGR02574 family)
MSVDAILKEIAALTATERAELKARMAEQFPDADTEPELSPELAKLLDERVAAADANPDAGYTWKEVYEESLKRARK